MRIRAEYEGKEFLKLTPEIIEPADSPAQIQFEPDGTVIIHAPYVDTDGMKCKVKIREDHSVKPVHCYPVQVEVWCMEPEYILGMYTQEDSSEQKLKIEIDLDPILSGSAINA